ncbi:MAG: hypothetical protein IPH76_17930 [Xanthomonadales bacterium]|nr:hypothetical protein [Xanthomonadales bacterium]
MSLHLLAFVMLLMIAMGLMLQVDVIGDRAQLAIGGPEWRCWRAPTSRSRSRVFTLRWWQATLVAFRVDAWRCC